MAWRRLPPDARRSQADWRPSDARTSPRGGIAADDVGQLDLPGVGLFSVAVIGLLAFLLSLGAGPRRRLLGLAGVAGVVLVARERQARDLLFDVRFLANNRRWVSLYVQFAAVSLIFYGAFFGLPLWLQQTRQFDARLAGLIVLPDLRCGRARTLVAARVIARRGVRPTLFIGSAALLVGVLLQLTLEPATTILQLVGVTAVIGIASAFNNLGLQVALYQAAPADPMGTASGQFQTFRYNWRHLCMVLIGVVFAGTATTQGLHLLALAMAPIAVLLMVASLGMAGE